MIGEDGTKELLGWSNDMVGRQTKGPTQGWSQDYFHGRAGRWGRLGCKNSLGGVKKYSTVKSAKKVVW